MSDNDSGVRTAPLPEIPAWKLDLVALHGKQVAGTLSRADAQRYMTILAEQGLNPGGAIVVSASSTGGTITPMSASYDAKSMTKTQKPQLQNNWCGPAAAQSIVLAWHNAKSYSTTSKFDGQALSQKALSGSDYTTPARAAAPTGTISTCCTR